MSAQQDYILITDVSSYLGTSLAKEFLSQNYLVYGSGKGHPSEELIGNQNFTFIDFDFSQPLPAHFPAFKKVYHFIGESHHSSGFVSSHNVSPATTNIATLARDGKSEVYLICPIRTNVELLDYLARDEETKKHLKLFLVGDLYGPGMHLAHSSSHHAKVGEKQTELADLISQAIYEDKIILQNEGQGIIYPSYIEDATNAILKLDLEKDRKNLRFLVSESGKTALSVAFELQKVARVTLEKELNLFFEGPEGLARNTQETEIKIPDTNFTPKFHMESGLSSTLKSFKDKGDVRTFAEPKKEEVQQPQITEAVHPPRVVEPKTETEKGNFREKLPRPTSNVKKAFLVVALLLVLTIAKTGLDLFLGVSSLTNSAKLLEQGAFKESGNKALSAQKSFNAAKNKINILTYPIQLISQASTSGLTNSLTSAVSASVSLEYFSQGAEDISQNLKFVTDEKATNQDFNTEPAATNFKKAYFESSKALTLLDNSSMPFLSGKLKSGRHNVELLVSASSAAWEFSKLLPQIVGTTTPKKYLVLLQNNMELRPGGGFIGSYAQIEFENSRLKNIKVEDIYTIDGQLQEVITPPPQLTEKLGADRYYLRDSNWSLDFEINAKTAKDFYKKETGEDIDGVIAIDLNYIQSLLEKIGPIKLEDYNEEITAANLFEKGEAAAEVGTFAGSTQKKDFFSSLTRNLINRFVQSFTEEQSGSNTAPLIATLDVSRNSLTEKHLMFWASDPALDSVIKTNSWSNPLPPRNFAPSDNSKETRDYIALAEANLGANKVNRFLKREVSYDMTVGKDADLMGTIKVNYKNESQANTWPGGTYVNYLRVFLPPGAGLIEYKNGESTNLADVTTTNINNLTELATYVEVPIKSSKEVVFKYRISKNIKLETAPTYSLYVQKQPGTENDKFNFTFHLPGYLKVANFSADDSFNEKDSISWSDDLKTDKRYEIKVARR